MTGHRRALIVASDSYEYPALTQVRSPAVDAVALTKVLGDPAIGGFEVENAYNEASYVLQARIEDFFTSARPEDLLLLHFSCHGLKSESGELFLAAVNTRPDRLASTAIAADFLQRLMRNSRSRAIILLLDCCYGGAFPLGVTVRAGTDAAVLENFPVRHLGAGRGRAVITASSSTEYALEGGRLVEPYEPRPSLFTGAVVEGLATGRADRDQDGLISLDDLYNYVFDQVQEMNPHQTPGRSTDLRGEIYIARNPYYRRQPEHPFAQLQSALQDPNVFARLGAVAELHAQLRRTNETEARSAYETLLRVAEKDIALVAQAAREALKNASAYASVPAETEPAGLAAPSAEVESAPQYRPPPTWVRAVARILDWVLFASLYLSVDSVPELWHRPLLEVQTSALARVALMGSGALIVLTQVAQLAAFSGTAGMLLTGLRLAPDQVDAKLSWRQCLTRFAVQALCWVVLGIGWIFLSLSSRFDPSGTQRGLHDRIAHTRLEWRKGRRATSPDENHGLLRATTPPA